MGKGINDSRVCKGVSDAIGSGVSRTMNLGRIFPNTKGPMKLSALHISNGANFTAPSASADSVDIILKATSSTASTSLVSIRVAVGSADTTYQNLGDITAGASKTVTLTGSVNGITNAATIITAASDITALVTNNDADVAGPGSLVVEAEFDYVNDPSV